jgi:hypothetical protein
MPKKRYRPEEIIGKLRVLAVTRSENLRALN